MRLPIMLHAILWMFAGALLSGVLVFATLFIIGMWACNCVSKYKPPK